MKIHSKLTFIQFLLEAASESRKQFIIQTVGNKIERDISNDIIAKKHLTENKKQRYHVHVKAHVVYPSNIDKNDLADDVRYGNYFSLEDTKIKVHEDDIVRISNFKQDKQSYSFDVDFKGTITTDKDPHKMRLYYNGHVIRKHDTKITPFSKNVVNESKKPWKEDVQSKGNKMTPSQVSKAKARARKAGRPYPNLIDNMAVLKQAKD